MQDPSAHFLSLSQQAFLQSVLEQDVAAFFEQQDFEKCEQADKESIAVRVTSESIFIFDPLVVGPL